MYFQMHVFLPAMETQRVTCLVTRWSRLPRTWGGGRLVKRASRSRSTCAREASAVGATGDCL